MRFFKVFIVCCCLSIFTAFANDGAYYASGNHLVPMMETDVRVQKEILTMERLTDGRVKITVYYEFFNPKAAKSLHVGFEARSPSGDVDGTPVKGQHPYISDFTVNLNGQNLEHSVAIVTEDKYYKKGKILQIPLKQALKSIENVNEIPFNYVYHFQADFKQGVNTLTHTYFFQLSGGVEMRYELPYILTAATRWGNRRIDDFTLKINMGAMEDFYIAQDFFASADEWEIEGVGKKVSIKKNEAVNNVLTKNTSHFWMREGWVIFRKTNFAPKKEFTLFGTHFFGEARAFNAVQELLPLPVGVIDEQFTTAQNEASLKILRNLPFARRGMVFKTPEIQRYYEKTPWYIPNPIYKAELEGLTKEEKEWLGKLQVEKK
jgi:hypothetical protein